MASAKHTLEAVIQMALRSARFPLRRAFLTAPSEPHRKLAHGDAELLRQLRMLLIRQPPVVLEVGLANQNRQADELYGEDDIGGLYAASSDTGRLAQASIGLASAFAEAGALWQRMTPAARDVAGDALGAARSHWLFMRDEAHWRGLQTDS